LPDLREEEQGKGPPFEVTQLEKPGMKTGRIEMPSIKGTETEKNLLKAFAGESQARNRYTYFASAARKEGYRLTSHCDVNIPNSKTHIRDCIEILGVEHIDHGLNAIEDDHLVQLLVDGEIPLAACPTRYAFEAEVPADGMAMMTGLLERGVRISLSSDDPAQFGSGWLTQTLVEAQRAGGLSRDAVIDFQRNAFLSAWLPNDRREYYLDLFDRFCNSFKSEC